MIYGADVCVLKHTINRKGTPEIYPLNLWGEISGFTPRQQLSPGTARSTGAAWLFADAEGGKDAVDDLLGHILTGDLTQK